MTKEKGGCKVGKKEPKGGCKEGKKKVAPKKKQVVIGEIGSDKIYQDVSVKREKELMATIKKMKKEKKSKALIENATRQLKKVKAALAEKKAKPKAKPPPKKKMVELPELKAITGLTKAQANKLSAVELFGMLPKELAKDIVLNPKRTGVKVGKLSAKELFKRGFVRGKGFKNGTSTLRDIEKRKAWSELPKVLANLVYTNKPMLKKGSKVVLKRPPSAERNYLNSLGANTSGSQTATVMNIGKKKITVMFPARTYPPLRTAAALKINPKGVSVSLPELKVLFTYDEIVKQLTSRLKNGIDVEDRPFNDLTFAIFPVYRLNNPQNVIEMVEDAINR